MTGLSTEEKLNAQHIQESGIIGLEETNSKLIKSEEPLILNIGGRKYETSLLTLSSNTSSILFKMFNDNSFLIKPSDDGSFFIDRDGENFKYILNYFRNQQLNIPKPYDVHLIDALLFEAQYYQIQSIIPVLHSKRLIFESKSQIFTEQQIHQICQQIPKAMQWKIRKKIYEYDFRKVTPDSDPCVDLQRAYKDVKSILIVIKIFNKIYIFHVEFDWKYSLSDTVDHPISQYGYVKDVNSYFIVVNDNHMETCSIHCMAKDEIENVKDYKWPLVCSLAAEMQSIIKNEKFNECWFYSDVEKGHFLVDFSKFEDEEGYPFDMKNNKIVFCECYELFK